MVLIKEITREFEKFAPLNIAEQGDPVGLQLGNLDNKTNKMMLTLDVRPEVVEEAIENNVDFIFAHHPMMFNAIKNFDLNNPQNKMYAKLIKNNITVYGAHTNLDNANNGMNDWLAQCLKLKKVSYLLDEKEDLSYGNYALGRVGLLEKEMSIVEFIAYVKESFSLKEVKVISNNLLKKVKKVAILGGSGGKFYPYALKREADMYITGDIFYHTGHDILAHKLTAIDAGHHIEHVCVNELKKLFLNIFKKHNLNVNIYVSKVNTDPFKFM